MKSQIDQRETVVLLHSLGTDRGLWDEQVPVLSEEYQVLLPESRGHGSSSWQGPVTVDSWVDDLRDSITAVTTAPVHLVGLSMGGIQAVAVAARHPELVCSLTVANSFAGLDSTTANARIDSIRDGITHHGMADYAEHYLDGALTQPTTPQTRTRLLSAITKMAAEAYIGSAEATFRADNTALLSHIDCPTVILADELDQKTPQPLANVLRDGISGAELRVLPGAGHLSNIDAPAAFGETLLQFLARSSRDALAETH